MPAVTHPLDAADKPCKTLFLCTGTGKLAQMTDMSADVIGLDWGTEMAAAREALGSVKVQGNVDPMVLFAPEQEIRQAVQKCISEAGPSGHILNVGHGVAQVSKTSS